LSWSADSTSLSEKIGLAGYQSHMPPIWRRITSAVAPTTIDQIRGDERQVIAAKAGNRRSRSRSVPAGRPQQATTRWWYTPATLAAGAA
jgi:hypothetical protein